MSDETARFVASVAYAKPGVLRGVRYGYGRTREEALADLKIEMTFFGLVASAKPHVRTYDSGDGKQ